MKKHQGYRELMSFLKTGKVGSSITCRGGYTATDNQFIFIKMNALKIAVYSSASYNTYPHHNEEHIPTKPIIITKDDITIYVSNIKDPWRYVNVFSDFFTIGDIESYGHKLLPLRTRWKINKNYLQCTNGDFLPQKVMKFDWDGNLLNPTKANLKATKKWQDSLKVRTNNIAKINREEKKLVDAFNFCREEGLLDEWPAKDALLFKNAQLRQQAIEAVGLDRVIGHLKQRILNTDTIDGRYYELIQLDIPNNFFDSSATENRWNKKIIVATYLKMINPSTDEIHLEGIPLELDNSFNYCPEETVECALAWRDGEIPLNNHANPSGDTSEWKYTKPEILT